MAQKDTINEIVGSWGPWQRRTSLLIFLCKIPSAWFMACIIFTAPTPFDGDYICHTPVVESLREKNYTNDILYSVHPQKITGESIELDYCNVYNWKKMNVTLNNSENFLQKEIIPCERFLHFSSFISLITQFDLVCNRTILVAVTQFFHLFGVLTGGILATKLLEYVSPRKVMLMGMITQIICGILTGTATVFEIHIFFRCLSAICCAQMFTAGPMIFQEITDGVYRTSVTCLYENFWSIGVIILPGIAYLFPDWTSIYMAISLPTIFYMLLWLMIPDAPRWLLRDGQSNKVKKILLSGAKINNRLKRLPSDLSTKLTLIENDILKERPQLGWWSLWHSKREVIRMGALHIAWAVYVTNYNGMLLNVKAFGREYLTINTIIFGCSEIIGVFIGLFLILETKRKWLFTGFFNIFAGIFACGAFFVRNDELTAFQTMILQMTMATIAKCAVSTSQAILFTCTGELVKPEQKKICTFSCVVWARIWLLTAPFIGALIVFDRMLPLAVFGILSAIGGVATSILMMPKTNANIEHFKSVLPLESLTSENLK